MSGNFKHDWIKLAEMNGFDCDRKMLKEWYINENLTTEEIACILNVGPHSVRARLKYRCLPIKKRGSYKSKLTDIINGEINV
jgi:hypothetical protein